jgi:hypothetical protein
VRGPFEQLPSIFRAVRVDCLREFLEVVVFVLPGGIHHTDDRPANSTCGIKPVFHAFRFVIVIAGNDLSVAAFREKLEAFRALPELPWQNDHILLQPVP